MNMNCNVSEEYITKSFKKSSMNFEMLSSIITLSIIVPYKWKIKLTDLNASTKIIS